MNDPLQFDAGFRVEVSGWDAAETFFVERSTLALSAGGERFVHLKHPLRAGLMLFLRLLDIRVGYPTIPIAYQVKHVAAERDGMSRVSLERLQHRQTSNGGKGAAAEPAGVPQEQGGCADGEERVK